MVERLTTALEGMKMTREEKEVIIASYQEATNRTSPIRACAACGAHDKSPADEAEKMR